MRDLLEKQIISDANNGDTTVLSELLGNLSDEVIYNSLSDTEQAKLVTYYEIHVCGAESYSTSIKCDFPLFSDDEIVNLAIDKGIIDYIDASLVDYVNELTFDEWNEWFNFNK